MIREEVKTTTRGHQKTSEPGAITECPAEGCGGNPELNKRKNITTNDLLAKRMTITEMKEKPNPDNYAFQIRSSRPKEMGEGDKIPVFARAFTARTGNPESCNCGLDKPKDTDNHIVLVDPTLKKPVLNLPIEKHSVTAEFTPRVKRVEFHHRTETVPQVFQLLVD